MLSEAGSPPWIPKKEVTASHEDLKRDGSLAFLPVDSSAVDFSGIETGAAENDSSGAADATGAGFAAAGFAGDSATGLDLSDFL